MIHGLNKRTVTIANAAAYGAGWAVDDAGQLTTEGLGGYVEDTALVAIQPLGRRRLIEEAGTEVETGYKVFFYARGGSWPTVRGGPDLDGSLLPTLLQWDGIWYEVQIVKDWREGLLPHIWAEVKALEYTRPATDSQEADDGEGGTDGLVY